MATSFYMLVSGYYVRTVKDPQRKKLPIISSVGPYNYELSTYLTRILKHNHPSPSYSYIKDSFEFMKKISGLKESKQQILVSFDVDNLYTNVLVQEAIEIALDALLMVHPLPSIDRN